MSKQPLAICVQFGIPERSALEGKSLGKTQGKSKAKGKFKAKGKSKAKSKAKDTRASQANSKAAATSLLSTKSPLKVSATPILANSQVPMHEHYKSM